MEPKIFPIRYQLWYCSINLAKITESRQTLSFLKQSRVKTSDIIFSLVLRVCLSLILLDNLRPLFYSCCTRMRIWPVFWVPLAKCYIWLTLSSNLSYFCYIFSYCCQPESYFTHFYLSFTCDIVQSEWERSEEKILLRHFTSNLHKTQQKSESWWMWKSVYGVCEPPSVNSPPCGRCD